jgi:ferredoxin
MHALSLQDSSEATNKKGQIAEQDPDLCIGCGVCAHKCPTDSLVLERREAVSHPPKDVQEWMRRYIEDHKKAQKSGE